MNRDFLSGLLKDVAGADELINRIMDENGRDIEKSKESANTLNKEIEGLKGKMTVILTTHYLEEAEALSDRVAIMKKGKILALGTADEIKEKAGESSFEEAFLKLTGDDYEQN